MRIDTLYLENFLGYGRLAANFSPGINFLVGKNATGKTNLAESIYFASMGKSCRGLRDKELIKWGEDESRIRVVICRKYSRHVVDIRIDKLGKKRIAVDRLPITKIGELMGVLGTVFFSADEIKLIKASPADRRRFMDISICQRDKLYFYKLLEYNKLLAQRNKLLKNYRDNARLRAMSDIIIEKLIAAEEYILLKRRDFVCEIAPFAERRHRLITGGEEDLKLEYETEETADFDNLRSSLEELYRRTFEKDADLQYTTAGSHRDDLKIAAGGIDVRKFGSRGQQRTSAVSLKLAEADIFRKATGEYPVLILDDVADELDSFRRRALFDGLAGIQAVITGTAVPEEIKEAAIFDICDHAVTERTAPEDAGRKKVRE